jgi:hypothetical protein
MDRGAPRLLYVDPPRRPSPRLERRDGPLHGLRAAAALIALPTAALRVLVGDHPPVGLHEALPELRETHAWPTSDGVYRVYEVAAAEALSAGTAQREALE